MNQRFFSLSTFICALLLTILSFPTFTLAQDTSKKQKMVFEEQKIEGKIRRPQLVLIKAEQRPSFAPMVMQSLAGNTNIVEFVDNGAIENDPYSAPFKFTGYAITGYQP
jgi:hypothetical protein